MKLTLIDKKDEAKGTKTFSFKSDEALSWIAGQYIYITLPKLNYLDERGATRHFTISSSPTENIVQVTTRIREESGYKKTLDELPIGSEVEGKGPQGTFMFEKSEFDNSEGNVFLAGGIGITPFRSLIKYNIDNNLKIPMHLIYSNSDSDFVFKSELDKWSNENNYIKVTYYDSSKEGHLDSVAIKKIIPDLSTPLTFWVVGPNVFVNSMEEALEELKIPENNIKSEKFTGY